MTHSTRAKQWTEIEKKQQLKRAVSEMCGPWAALERKETNVAKITDTQIDLSLFHGGTAHQVIHSPSGQTPPHGPDAPNVATDVVAFSAGKPLVPVKLTLAN